MVTKFDSRDSRQTTIVHEIPFQILSKQNLLFILKNRCTILYITSRQKFHSLFQSLYLKSKSLYIGKEESSVKFL